MPYALAPAQAADAADCIRLRGLTRENAVSEAALAAIGITVASWAEGIRTGALPGTVARTANGQAYGPANGPANGPTNGPTNGQANGQACGQANAQADEPANVPGKGPEVGTMAGYAFGDAATGEVLVLALLPAHEGQGLGRRLLQAVVQALRARGHGRLFLGCSPDPAVRSHGFYRHLGWRSTGQFDAHGDEVLELLCA